MVLENYHDHTLRCGILTIASKKIETDSAYLEQFMDYQMSYFQKLNIVPTMDLIMKFNRSIEKFSQTIFKFKVHSEKLKLAFFTRWRQTTFSLKRPMLEVTAEIIRQKLEIKSKQKTILEEFFSFRNRSRFRRVVFESFTKWKL